MFFNDKIQEIASRNQKPWDLMSWVCKHKLPTTETIQFNGHPYIKLNDSWQALYLSFNSAHNCQINIDILDKVQNKPVYE